MRTKIIYLDDEPACLSVFEAAFGAEYDIGLAVTPAEARALLGQGEPDVFISDQCLGATSGTDFLAEVATLSPASYRVLLTGTAALGGFLAEVSSGVVEAFATKPWTEEGIRHLVARAEAARAPRAFDELPSGALPATSAPPRVSWPSR